MKRKALFNIAASSLIIASTMVGCSGAALNERAGLNAGKLDKMAGAQALGAEKAIAKGDASKAILTAEAAVEASPNAPANRTILGRAYLLDGRFHSARTAFEDALTLGSTDTRTIVNLALIHTAQGRSAAARALLSEHMAHLPAADYGLAMAMSGDANEAIRVLSKAIHDPAATAKERQNLAYSYALAGHWTEARQMASVDLPPLAAAQRVLGWARTAQPGGESARVLAMMGVTPRGDDAGLPVRLALGQPTLETPIHMAAAEPVEAAPSPEDISPEGNSSVEMASADNILPAFFDKAAEIVSAEPTELAAPVQPAPANPAMQQAALTQEPEVSAFLRPKPTMLVKTEIPASSPAAKWLPVNPDSGSKWVVQLGAFSTAKAAKASWRHYVGHNSTLGVFPAIHSSATVRGKEYYRVAVAGFSGRSDANKFCANIRSDGGKCFVRLGGAEAAPSQWAAALKKMQTLAMR